MGIKQTDLAEVKLLSVTALVAFEKGRAWPRDRTRAKLEALVNWPPGTLEKLRAGGQAPGLHLKKGAADELVSDAVTMAATSVMETIDRLPATDDRTFPDRVQAALASLRHLEMLTAKAVRTSQGSAEVIKLLREIRQRYDELMSRAVAAPGATLGQRLYVARNAAALSVAEAAGALDVAPDVVLAAESEQPVSAGAQQRMEALIAALSE